ncbi:hypothetical protein BD310DRAFT_914612 [Dichomitus squalens]|uniref:Uncharacterized protein n=1 Tax=Dichomitus squalens TaxID=114155 RepID=A0A4Q9QAX2_9APHY|nr:hypothetical protein BD310DRAFT_914612 [Dichomitus squalens]
MSVFTKFPRSVCLMVWASASDYVRQGSGVNSGMEREDRWAPVAVGTSIDRVSLLIYQNRHTLQLRSNVPHPASARSHYSRPWFHRN